jgi:hypothetical protein
VFATGARYKATVPVCIAGMPYSGMALVSQLLGGLGLDLGPTNNDLLSPDGEGRFSQLNDEILHAVDAAWNSPPPRGSDWVRAAQLEPLRRSAATQADVLGLSEPWGWADPRNSLTLPFWRELFPDLHLLVCVRDPREVADSLQTAGAISSHQALSLWEEYYGALELAKETCAITHYDSYRNDPKAELERLARGLGLDSSRVAIARAAAGLKLPTNTVDVADGTFPRRLRDLHDRLREAAKSPLPDAPAPGSQPSRRGDLSEPLEAQRRELEHLRLELARARGHIDALRAELEVRSLEPADLRDVALGLEQQLVERDEELERFRQAVREGDAWRREMEAVERRTEAARREAEEWVDALREELELLKSTRLWSLGHRYWTLKERLRQMLGRQSS